MASPNNCCDSNTPKPGKMPDIPPGTDSDTSLSGSGLTQKMDAFWFIKWPLSSLEMTEELSVGFGKHSRDGLSPSTTSKLICSASDYGLELWERFFSSFYFFFFFSLPNLTKATQKSWWIFFLRKTQNNDNKKITLSNSRGCRRLL